MKTIRQLADEGELAKMLYRKIYKIFGYRIVPQGNEIANINKKYFDLAKAISTYIKEAL